MRINHLKHKIVLALFAIAICKTEIASAGVADSLKNDTIVLSQDQIQFVETYCNNELYHGELEKQPLVINSQKEFEANFTMCALSPLVDLSSRTLLFFATESAGSLPYYENTVKIIRDTVICDIEIIHPGNRNGAVFLVPAYRLDVISIPKIKPNQKVVFKKFDSYDGISRGKYINRPVGKCELVRFHGGVVKNHFSFALTKRPYNSIVKVYNTLNEVVYTGVLNIAETEIDLSQLGPGVYEYKVFDQNEDMQAYGKLFIQ